MKAEAIIFCCLLVGTVISKPAKDGKKDRVYDRPLSDVDHHEDDDDEHDAQHDHESFLGKEESKKFDHLTPEESKERLGKIVEDKIDTNKDGKVSAEELRHWIQLVSRRYLVEDGSKQWSEHNIVDNKLSWEEYSKKAFADSSEDTPEELQKRKGRDERRFKKADKDSDGFLNKDEFIDFLHPEEAVHMRDIVVDETLDDIDKNKDGFVDIDEYISDMWMPSEGEKEPEWVTTEREQFKTQRDKDHDGRLNRDEVRDWIMPEDYDHVNAEANHLIQQADADKDGMLTRQEVLDKYDVFVGSQATDFGEVLNKPHEEL